MLHEAPPAWPAPAVETVGTTTLRTVDHSAEMQVVPARVLVMDPGLRNAMGHHLQLVAALATEAKARGYRVGVIGHREMSDDVQGRRYQPWFRAWTYDRLSDDPLVGWMESHNVMTGAIIADLERLPIEPDDVILWPTANAAHLQALAAWSATHTNRVIAAMGFDVGVDKSHAITAPEAAAWRYAFRALKVAAPNVEVISWHATTIDVHRFIAGGVPVERVPVPVEGTPRNRAGDNPVVIGFAGHQRPAKGLLMLPDIIDRLKIEHGDRVRFVVHDSGDYEGDIWTKIAATGAEVIRQGMSSTEYDALLSRLSVLVLPYNHTAYATMPSGLAYEALATALPMVLPNGSDPDALARGVYQAGVSAFREWTPGAIADAVSTVVNGLDGAAGRSLAAASQWQARNGVAALFDAVGL